MYLRVIVTSKYLPRCDTWRGASAIDLYGYLLTSHEGHVVLQLHFAPNDDGAGREEDGTSACSRIRRCEDGEIARYHGIGSLLRTTEDYQMEVSIALLWSPHPHCVRRIYWSVQWVYSC